MSHPPASAHDLGALAKYHEFTRTTGTNRWLYRIVRAVLKPLLLSYLTVTRTGAAAVPPEGGLLVVANHRSFLDPFLIALLLPGSRPICFMGKAELFARPRAGWFLNRCGCFPVRRGESDPDAIETARRVLARGGALVVFPEGTRLRAGGLGQPRRGAFRTALQTGASVLPVCILGTENVRRARVLILPAHCQVHASELIDVDAQESTPDAAGKLRNRAWKPIVELWVENGGDPAPGRRAREGLRARMVRALWRPLRAPRWWPPWLRRRK